MKIAMLQFDERTGDENINAIIEVNRKYCSLHNYDYIFHALIEEDTHKHELDDYLTIKDNEHAFCQNVYDYRIYMIEKYMNDYDYVVYLDTDMLINKPQIKIEDLIDNQHDIFMFRDGDEINASIGLLMIAQTIYAKLKNDNVKYLKEPLNNLLNMKICDERVFERLARLVTNPNGLASGFMIINCHSSKLKNFIEDFKRFYPLFGCCKFDQGCITTLLRRHKYKDMLHVLPIYLHGNPFVENNELTNDFKYDPENAFVCHFFGTNKNEESDVEKKYIENIKNNKWWSQYNENLHHSI